MGRLVEPNRGAVGRILVVLLGALGDVVRGLAIAAPLKRHFPGVVIDWLVEPLSASIVDNCQYVDNTIVFERGKQGAIRRVYNSLRANHYDLVLDLQRHFKSGLFSLVARGSRSVGVNRRDAKEFNWLFHRERVRYFGEEEPKQYQYMEFLNYLGVPWSEPLDFGLVPNPMRATELLEISGGIGVVLGSSWPSKDWLPNGYHELVTGLVGASQRVVLLGDSRANELGAKLAAIHPAVVNLCGKTKVVDLVHVLAALSCAVGPDSGPGHIAAALGVPYVSLFGPTSPKRVGFYHSTDLAISYPIGCSGCYRKHCPGLDRLCMRLISPKVVEERVLEVLRLRR